MKITTNNVIARVPIKNQIGDGHCNYALHYASLSILGDMTSNTTPIIMYIHILLSITADKLSMFTVDKHNLELTNALPQHNHSSNYHYGL